MGAFACFIVSLDCFSKNGGEIGLPYWLWAVTGFVWFITGICEASK